MANICDLLEEGRFSEALTILSQPIERKVTKDALTLVPAACLGLQLVTEESELEVGKEVLVKICGQVNPREALLALVSGAEGFRNDETRFCLLLTPIQEVLHRVPGKRGKSLHWVLSTLHSHMAHLPLPPDHQLLGDELLLLDSDPDVCTVAQTLSQYLLFLKPLVEEVNIHREALAYSDRIDHQREILHIFLLKLLDHPLVFHDLRVRTGKAISSVQVCCQLLMNYITSTTKNIFTLYQLQGCPCLQEPESSAVPTVAIGNLAYLRFVENFAIDHHPYVYSHAFLFRKHMSFMEAMLPKKENLVIFKGLALCQVLLKNVDDLELVSYSFDHKFSDLLLDIAIYCQVEEHRTLAVKLFSEHVRKFQWRCRYSRLMEIISRATHSGVRGLAIDTYRDFLHHSLQFEPHINAFIGKNLHLFLSYALHLEEGAETDILKNCDQIVSGLNLVRYVILCDTKERNVTGIWDVIESIVDTSYLTPLQHGIELSKAHYALEARLAKEGQQCEDKNDINDSVTVNNEILPNLSPTYKIDVLKKALLTLDMIESILFRVKEILGH